MKYVFEKYGDGDEDERFIERVKFYRKHIVHFKTSSALKNFQRKYSIIMRSAKEGRTKWKTIRIMYLSIGQ